MTAPKASRGWCPVCERDIEIKRDGTLRHHGGPIGSGYPGWNRAYRCDGAGKAPVAKPAGGVS